MKIKNLAFFGVMASILSVAGAYADDNTIIASKAYVDAKSAAANSSATTAATNAINALDLSTVSATGKPIVSVGQSNGQLSAATGEITTAGIASTAKSTSIAAASSAVDTKLTTEKAVRTELDKKFDKTQSTKDGILTTNASTGAVEVSATIPNTKVSGLGSLAVKSTVGTADVTSGSLSTSIPASSSASDTKFATEKAVALAVEGATSGAADAIDALDLATVSSAGKPIVSVGQADGKVSATVGTISTAGIDNSAVTTDKLADDAVTTAKITNKNVTTDKLADSAVTTAKIANANVTMGKTDFVVKQGTSTAAWNSASSSSTNTDEKGLATANAAGDNYVPTLAAVEKRIGSAVSSGISGIAEVSKNATTNQVVTGVTTEAGSVKSVTSSSIKTAMIDNSAITTDKLNSKAVTAAKIADNTITASQIANGTITATQLAANAVESAKIKDEAVTIGKVASGAKSTAIPATGASNDRLATEKAVADAVAGAKSDATTAISALNVSTITTAGQPIVSVGETAGKVTAASGTITYKAGMDSALKQIDSATTNATCSVSSPCILTYTGTDYKWTNMDTAGDSAVANAS